VFVCVTCRLESRKGQEAEDTAQLAAELQQSRAQLLARVAEDEKASSQSVLLFCATCSFRLNWLVLTCAQKYQEIRMLRGKVAQISKINEKMAAVHEAQLGQHDKAVASPILCPSSHGVQLNLVWLSGNLMWLRWCGSASASRTCSASWRC
jgi:hypothetical protein